MAQELPGEGPGATRASRLSAGLQILGPGEGWGALVGDRVCVLVTRFDGPGLHIPHLDVAAGRAEASEFEAQEGGGGGSGEQRGEALTSGSDVESVHTRHALGHGLPLIGRGSAVRVADEEACKRRGAGGEVHREGAGIRSSSF